MAKFDKSKRLLRDKDFKEIFVDSKKLISNYFIFLYKKNSFAHNRLGLIITKKRVPLATQRNRIRRLIREVYRSSFISNNFKYDVILMAKYNITSVANQDIMIDLKNTFNDL